MGVRNIYIMELYINKIKNSRKEKILCPLCDKKAKAETLGVWSLRNGAVVCCYGVCGSCSKKQSELTGLIMAHICEYKLMSKHESIRERLPQDEVDRVLKNMSELS